MCEGKCRVLLKWLSLHDTAQMVPAPSSHLSSADICEHQPAKNQSNVKNMINIQRWRDGWGVIWSGCERLSCQEWGVLFLCRCLSENVMCKQDALCFPITERREDWNALTVLQLWKETWLPKPSNFISAISFFNGVTGRSARQPRTRITFFSLIITTAALSVSVHLVTAASKRTSSTSDSSLTRSCLRLSVVTSVCSSVSVKILIKYEGK